MIFAKVSSLFTLSMKYSTLCRMGGVSEESDILYFCENGDKRMFPNWTTKTTGKKAILHTSLHM